MLLPVPSLENTQGTPNMPKGKTIRHTGLPPNPHLRIPWANSSQRLCKGRTSSRRGEKTYPSATSLTSLCFGSQITSTSVFSDIGFSLAGKQMFIEKYSRIKPWIVHWHMHKGKYPFIQYYSTEVTTKNTHTYKNTQSHTHSQSYTYTNLHTHPKCKDENKLSLEFIEYERKTRIYSPSIKTEVCFLQTWTHVIWKLW